MITVQESAAHMIEVPRITPREAIASMLPEEFRECLGTIGWRVGELAWVLNIDVRVTSRWASGGRDVPLYVGHWLRKLSAFHTANPFPEGWRVIDDGENTEL